MTLEIGLVIRRDNEGLVRIPFCIGVGLALLAGPALAQKAGLPISTPPNAIVYSTGLTPVRRVHDLRRASDWTLLLFSSSGACCGWRGSSFMGSPVRRLTAPWAQVLHPELGE